MATAPQMSARSWAELLALALIWGATFMFTEIALVELGPLTAVVLRVAIGALVLWAVVWLRGLKVPASWALWGAFAVMGLLNNLIPFSLITFGQLTIESGLAAILNATTGVFGVLTAAWFLADEPLRAHRLAGVSVAFAGVVVTVGPSLLAGLDPRALGQLAVLGAAFSYALAGVWGRSRLGGVDPVIAATGMVTLSAATLMPVAVAVEGWPGLSLAPVTWAALAYQGAAATALAYLLYYRILARAGSGNLLVVTLLLPPVALALGTAILREPLVGHQIGGFAVVALGLLLIDGRVLGRR